MISRAVALALMLTVAACDGGLISGGGEGRPIGAQIVHPNATVLQVLSLKRGSDRSAVTIRIFNARDRDITLNEGSEQSYILTDNGEKLLLVPGAANGDLSIPAGKAMDGEIIFSGKLPSSGTATLIFNANGSRDSAFTASPRFEVTLPLDAAGGGGIPDASALSGMRAIPASRMGPAGGGGSSLGNAGTATSSLALVDRLKSELGATESDRGTIISLAGDITFDFNKASIRADAEPTLARLAELISAGGSGEIAIEGHTDAKGEDAFNKRLSEQRAQAVKAYLVGKGVAEARLRTIGLGELRPVAPNAKPDGSDDEVGRQRNRRVEVVLPKATAPGGTASPTPTATP
ncbi:OmpA family protein [Sphingomonas mucosissima]|uniref:Photosystem I P700 chlorophyll a apoprotein A2 n=1 Tax=Sphingomonas mucosissima TaxID=370959 RepID=A0A245ZRN9_9SPHN|nr:OmpA family protein [Sphingomonas mucosissima]OWK32396.1 photosystem I P700 chlorophyll a apoprotein A2 [Sphingomonas mucosissima]